MDIGVDLSLTVQVIPLVHVGTRVLLVMALDRKVISELKALYALPVIVATSFMAQKKEHVYPMAVGLGGSQSAKLYNVVTQEQQQMEKSSELMVQPSPALSSTPAWKVIFFQDHLLDSAPPMEHGLEVCPTVQLSVVETQVYQPMD